MSYFVGVRRVPFLAKALQRSVARQTPFMLTTFKFNSNNNNNNNNNNSQHWRFFKSKVLLALPLLACAAASDEFKEPATGLPFPRKIENGNVFIGASVRTVTFLKFKAYAIGLYLPQHDLNVIRQSVLQATDESLLNTILDRKFGSTVSLRIKPVGQTVGSHLLAAWIGKLTAKLSTIEKDKMLHVAKKEKLDELTRIIGEKKKYDAGCSLDFTWNKELSQLVVAHNGMQIGTIQDDLIPQLFFGIYLDESSNVSNIKADFVKALRNPSVI